MSDQWYTANAGQGDFHLQIIFKPSRSEPLTIESFELLKVIGKGSFGKVMQVRKKDTQRIYALKTIRKAHIASRPGEITHILAERTVLALVNNPFIVPLKFSFQTPDKLYLVMSFVNGGELFYHLQREGRFDQHRSRFYAAELLCALEHLHAFNVVYRDLKPENILLDYTGHIALCDFGLCKLNMSETDKTNSESLSFLHRIITSNSSNQPFVEPQNISHLNSSSLRDTPRRSTGGLLACSFTR
jgi:serum/glucocorticoid-regulated kinase 2